MDKEKTTKFAYQHLEELGYSREMVSSKKTLNGEDIDLVVNFREKPIIAVKIITGSFDDYRAFNRISILFFLSTTPYLILINKEKQVVWLETKVGLVLQADNPVNFSRVLPNIQTIHEEIFNFLYQQHQDFQEQREKLKLKFKLRQKNTRSRLQKGYWFPGNDNHLTISFWQGRDSLNKTPYIYFNIDRDGSMTLYFVAKTSETLKMFYASQLAKVLNLKPDKRDKNNQVTVWSKEYYSHWQGDYLKVLEDFIYRERIIIDNFIFIENRINNNFLDGLFTIDDDEFKSNIENIQQYRTKKHFEIKLSNNYKNAPIIPNQLILNNIGRFNHLNLDIQSKVICFLGENGSGKTTILRSLLLALTGTEETTLIDTTDLRFQRMLKINDVESNGNIQYHTSGEIELVYHHNHSCAGLISFELKNENVIIEDKEYPNIPSFTTTYDNDYYTQLIIGFSQVQGKSKSNGEQKTLNPIRKANIRDILPLLYDKEDNRFEDLSDWIIGLYGEAQKDKNNEEFNVLTNIFNIISEITDSTIELIDVNFLSKVIWIKLNNEKPILFSLLSQGYKNVFAWVGHFMKRLAESNEYSKDFMQQPAILAIDEIDTYLHPTWQRNILNVLVKHFTNTRFFITTHSPLIANYYKNDDISVYVLEGNDARKINHVYGTELSRAYYNWMGINSRPEDVQKQINNLFQLLDQEKTEDAQVLYKKLSSMLGTQDADMVEAKTELDLILEN